MLFQHVTKRWIGAGALALAMTGASSLAQAAAVIVKLVALPLDETLPSGVVRMWGFETDTGQLCPAMGGAAAPDWNVGPQLAAMPGDSLTVKLRNCLDEPVSLMIIGQLTALSPVRNLDGRARSLTAEVLPAATGTYNWSALKGGTFLYRSATRLATQVPMGLYGALVVGGAASDLTLVYSEIDPAQHVLTVVTPLLVPTKPTAATPRDYFPTYFLLNGSTDLSATPLAAGSAGGATRLRLVNAGLRSRVPTLLGGHLDFVAEDGNDYPFPRRQVGALLAPGKTLDAIFSPTTGGQYALYDRALALSTNNAPGGGMLAKLGVGGGAATANAGPNQVGNLVPSLVTLDGSASFCGSPCLSYAWSIAAPPGSTAPSTATGVSPTFTADVPGIYQATLVVDGSPADAVDVITNQRPHADAGADQVANLFVTPPLSVGLDGSASADSDTFPVTPGAISHSWVFSSVPGGSSITGPLSGPTPSFSPDVIGPYTLALTVSDGNLSVADSVTVDVKSFNEKPLAIGDRFALMPLANISPPWNLIANDYDANGSADINPASLAISGGLAATCALVNPHPLCATVGGVVPANTFLTARGGWVTNNLDGSVTYRRKPGYRGTDSFNYRVRDAANALSNIAVVRINAR